MYYVSCVISHVLSLMSYVLCLMSHVSCLMYDFLCLFFLGDTTFNVCNYTLEQALDHLDNSLGDYNELLTYEDKVEIYSIAKEIKSSS